MQTFEYVIRYNILSVAHRELTEQMLVMVVVMMNELAQQVLMGTALHCCLSGESTGARVQKKLFDPVTLTWAAQRGRAPPGWWRRSSSVLDTRVRC